MYEAHDVDLALHFRLPQERIERNQRARPSHAGTDNSTTQHTTVAVNSLANFSAAATVRMTVGYRHVDPHLTK